MAENKIIVVKDPEPMTPQKAVMGALGISLDQLIKDIIDSGPDGKYGALYVKTQAEA